jgi:hypothetical protein
MTAERAVALTSGNLTILGSPIANASACADEHVSDTHEATDILMARFTSSKLCLDHSPDELRVCVFGRLCV